MTRHCIIVFSLSLSFCFSGCTLLKKKDDGSIFGIPSSTNAQPEKIKFGQPVKMAVVWKDSTLTAPGTPPTRGFGGRFYFFDKKNKPIRVDGKLMIYAYDDSEEAENAQGTQADRRYEYEAADLQKHYSETDIGHSYSVWVPWDKIGGFRKTITLIPMFRAKSGQVVRGGHDIVVLPGKATPSDKMNQIYRGINSPNGKLNVTYASQRVNYNGPPINPKKMDTTTINLPRTMQNRLSQTADRNTAPKTETVLPPGITPQMIEQLQQSQPKNSLPVTYGTQKPVNPRQQPVTQQNPTASLPAESSPPNTPTTGTTAKKQSRAFGAPGSFR